MMQKMISFYHVYINRIVGQVAVSGEHQWVFPEYFDNCQSEFEVRNFLFGVEFFFFIHVFKADTFL